MKNGKKCLRNLGIAMFIFSIILLFIFHLFSFVGYIDFLIIPMYLASFPIFIALKNAQRYHRLTKEIDNNYSLIKKGDLKSLFKKSDWLNDFLIYLVLLLVVYDAYLGVCKKPIRICF